MRLNETFNYIPEAPTQHPAGNSQWICSSFLVLIREELGIINNWISSSVLNHPSSSTALKTSINVRCIMNLETIILSRDKDNQVGSFHDCQCLRAKGTIGYHLTSSLSFHSVLISHTLQGSMGPYDRRTVTTVLGEHNRPQVSTRGQKEGPHEHKKMTRE